MRLTLALVITAMLLQGLFLGATLLLPWLTAEGAVGGGAAAELRQTWWRGSGFAPLMAAVLVALPLLAAAAPKLRPTSWLRAGSATYALAILAQALMLVVLWRDAPLAAPAGPLALWGPGIAAFGLWLLAFSLILSARRQGRRAISAAG